jgi:nitrite reductase/ring-hydroxylating ferredoxin subunit
MVKLPAGIVVEGDEVRVDLRAFDELRSTDGVLEVPQLALLLVRGRRRIRAFCTYCPHKRAKERPIERVEGARPRWICRHHGWTWDRKGRPTGEAEEGLDRWQAEIVGDEVIVRRG